MANDDAVAALARVLGHETCIRLIDALAAGEATVSDLASRLDRDQPRISTHLGLMREVGLVDCRASGRQRVYSLRGQAPELALAALRTLAAGLGARGARAAARPAARLTARPATRPAARPTGDSPLRLGRTCYDHLAGVAGVQLLDGLLARGWLEPAGGPERPEGGDGRDRRELRVTEAGARALARIGVDLPPARRSRRPLAFQCPDWTERRPHLAGALGAALLAALLAQGRLRLRPGERAVDLEPGEPAALLEAAGA